MLKIPSCKQDIVVVKLDDGQTTLNGFPYYKMNWIENTISFYI